jgi:rubrerythrin
MTRHEDQPTPDESDEIFICLNCGYESQKETEDCPNCGGELAVKH